VVAPETHEELAEIIRQAEADRVPVVPAGLGAHAYLGNPPPQGALIVSTRRFDRVLRYEPDDFTAGVEAGMPLSAFREALARNDQEIPVDIPSSARGTVGGLVAAAEPGPRRARHGPIRSYVIGVRAMRGSGAIYKAGGMVVKNVAGYEVAKFLSGSLGTAGFLLEVNFKLRPLPARRAARVAAFRDVASAWEFARALRARTIEPAAVSILRGEALAELEARSRTLREAGMDRGGAWVAWILEGNAAAVAWQEAQAESLQGGSSGAGSVPLSGADFDALLDFLTELPSPGAEPRNDLGIVRLAALPSEVERLEEAAIRALDAEGLPGAAASDPLSGLVSLRWRGTPGDLARPLSRLERLTRELAGTGVLLYLPPDERRTRSHGLFPDPNREVSRRLLGAFDPGGAFFADRILGSG
jgi:glycolate oxidase FAD binding subunit